MSAKRIHLSIDFTDPTGKPMRYAESVILHEQEISALGGMSRAHGEATRRFEDKFVRHLQTNDLFYGSSIGHLRSETEDWPHPFYFSEEARVEVANAI